jgi:Arc/MetJ family transcription regulator
VCKEEDMATNLALDDNLLALAQKVGGMKTKKDTVNAALKEFIERRRQEEIVSLFGTIEWDRAYDYKELRKRK